MTPGDGTPHLAAAALLLALIVAGAATVRALVAAAPQADAPIVEIALESP